MDTLTVMVGIAVFVIVLYILWLVSGLIQAAWLNLARRRASGPEQAKTASPAEALVGEELVDRFTFDLEPGAVSSEGFLTRHNGVEAGGIKYALLLKLGNVWYKFADPRSAQHTLPTKETEKMVNGSLVKMKESVGQSEVDILLHELNEAAEGEIFSCSGYPWRFVASWVGISGAERGNPFLTTHEKVELFLGSGVVKEAELKSVAEGGLDTEEYEHDVLNRRLLVLVARRKGVIGGGILSDKITLWEGFESTPSDEFLSEIRTTQLAPLTEYLKIQMDVVET